MSRMFHLSSFQPTQPPIMPVTVPAPAPSVVHHPAPRVMQDAGALLVPEAAPRVVQDAGTRFAPQAESRFVPVQKPTVRDRVQQGVRMAKKLLPNWTRVQWMWFGLFVAVCWFLRAKYVEHKKKKEARKQPPAPVVAAPITIPPPTSTPKVPLVKLPTKPPPPSLKNLEGTPQGIVLPPPKPPLLPFTI